MDYETDEGSERAFSRIPWVVEKVDDLDGQLLFNRTVSTTRPWIGEYDKAKMHFRLTEPRRFFQPQFVQIVVRGRIAISDNKTTINIKLRLGVYAFVLLSMIYLMTVFMTVEVISSVIASGDIGYVAGFALWILVFPGMCTFLLHLKLNAIEKKVEDLFGLR